MITRIRIEAKEDTEDEVYARLMDTMDELVSNFGGTWIFDEQDGRFPDGLNIVPNKKGYWGHYTKKLAVD